MYSITKQWNVGNSGSDHTLNRGSVIATQSPGGGPQGLSLTSFRSLLTPPGCSGVTPEGVVSYHKEWVSQVIYFVMEREGVQEAWGGVTRGGARRLVGGMGECVESSFLLLYSLYSLYCYYLLCICYVSFWRCFGLHSPHSPIPPGQAFQKTGGNAAFLTPPAAILFPLFSI